MKSFLLGEKKIVIFYGFHASNKVRVWYHKAATEAVLAEASKAVERLFFLQLANLQREVQYIKNRTMEVDHNGCNGNSTNSNVRGKKRSGNHLDHVEDLPPEKSSTDVTSVSQRRHPTHFEVSREVIQTITVASIGRNQNLP